MSLLNLQSFHVLSQQEHESHLEITVENLFKPQACPHCGFTQLYSHDKTEQIFFDMPMQGKPLVLKTQRVRYKCRSCGKTFREPLADIDGKRLMTTRLKEYIQKRSMSDTFAVVARETGLDEKTIRHVFDDYVAEKSKEMPFETPRVLGIDELKLVGSYRCILTNIEKCSVFDMLPSRKKADVMKHLKSLKNPEKVEIVTMDMWLPYRDTVKQILPDAVIVIDKFHIVATASKCLEKACKGIRSQLEKKERIKKNDRFVLLKRRHSLTDKEVIKLQQWSARFPDLGLAYDAKEAFYCLFDQGLDSKAAEQALIDWQRGLSPQIAHYFEALTTALSNWMPEILNGFVFDYEITNAYTESINRYAKDVQRMGRGYSFNVVRAKMLYNAEANKPTTSTIRKKKRKPIEEAPVFYLMLDNLTGSASQKQKYRTEIIEEKRYYGAHIPTLCELLEKGEFD
ncbi:ISL3 family transposase [Hydrogenovibrio sp. JE_KL2]|uniref:ISL3 family transposase n=1 Tax=Hydrogenovibrio sp. JE_KL2 TaxID=2651188 RepID=UPI00128CEC77|nr:ISL3 family transposase [Hydrogenovibrio sp. JE_KL2]MPQ75813.1 ISL3 family transposase [Hydrogenovibrio sp. JE_KL2]